MPRRMHPSIVLLCSIAALTTALVLGNSIANGTSHASSPSTLPQGIVGRNIAIVEHAEIEEKHRTIAAETLKFLPEKCQETLRSFVVRYDHPKQRGLAGKTSMILAGHVSDREFRSLFIHEYGHITDLGCLEGTKKSGPSGFQDGGEVIFGDDPSVSFYRISWLDEFTKNKGVASRDFVSGYAARDAFEDFAETYAYYVLQREAFWKRAKENDAMRAKLQWMETHVFTGFVRFSKGLHQWDGIVPWDVTKLPYSLKPRAFAAGHARQ